MVSLFKERSAPAVFWAVITCFALHAFFLVTPPAVVALPGDGLLYYFLRLFVKLPAIVLTIVYFALVIIQALRLNYVLNDNRMFQKTSFAAALSYILFTAIWPACNNITAPLVINGMLVWLLFRIVKLYNVKQPKALVYNIGLISGSMVLLYFPAAGIIPVVFISLGLTRAFRVNEWLVLLLGIITPFYFCVSYLFLTNHLAALKVITGLFYIHGITGPAKTIAVAFSGAGLLLIAGIARWQSSRILLIQVRKIWSVIFIMLLCLLPSVFIVKNGWPYALLIACVPASALAAHGFLYPKGPVPAILFWLMVVVIAYVNWPAM